MFYNDMDVLAIGNAILLKETQDKSLLKNTPINMSWIEYIILTFFIFLLVLIG